MHFPLKKILACSALVLGAAVAHAQIVIKFSHVVAQDTPKGKASEFFAKKAAELTHGKVKVEVYANSSLYKDKEEMEALQLGSVQMLAPSLAKFGPLGVKEFEVFDLPFIFDDYNDLHKVTAGPVGAKLHKKLLKASELSGAQCSPETLEMLAKFCVMTRLKEHENSNLISKMRVYDGEKLKDTDPKAKTLQEYKDAAGVDEGMTGISTRFAYKTLSETFNYDHSEVAADPVHLMFVLEQAIKREQYPDETEKKYLEFIKAELAPRYAEFIGKEIQKAYLESYGEYGQNLFDRYIAYADAWIEDQDYKDADTGQLLNREALDNELSKIEKPAGIANPKDFRNEVVKFALRYRAQNEGKNPAWTAYEKIRSVIEKRMFTQVEDLLPVISFESKKDSETETKHNEFVKRMLARGYTARQVRRLVEWYMRVNKAG